MSNWRLEHPWLALAALVVWLAVVWLRRRREERLPLGGMRVRAGGWRGASVALHLSTLLLIAALANPQYGVEPEQASLDAIAILNVLDASQSMEALDFGTEGKTLTRMAGAKQVLAEFLRNRPDDLHGLVVFGEKVMTLVPLTSDPALVLEMIDQVYSGIAGQATAIGDAIALGVRRLLKAPVRSRVMIFLSDGTQTAGEIEPADAARFAKEKGIRIYTIGIGSGDLAPFAVDTIFGKKIRKLKVPLDEATLTKVAETTGGRYFNARNIEQLRAVYRDIDQLERTTVKARRVVLYEDRYPPLLQAGLLLLVAVMFWQLLIRPRYPWS
ncbi:MAG: VWA domain-containing protein [Candidatus Dadabacteria bacterium]|nr:MAG: VWA domain-containing protein [Candidatus Dadabacteria bacterium]